MAKETFFVKPSPTCRLLRRSIWRRPHALLPRFHASFEPGETVEFNVSHRIDETVELFSGAACDKGTELICSTPPGKTVAAVGDSQRIKQILINLLGNAVKFTQDGRLEALRVSELSKQDTRYNRGCLWCA